MCKLVKGTCFAFAGMMALVAVMAMPVSADTDTGAGDMAAVAGATSYEDVGAPAEVAADTEMAVTAAAETAMAEAAVAPAAGAVAAPEAAAPAPAPVVAGPTVTDQEVLALFVQGVKLYKEGDYAGARNAFDKVLTAQPGLQAGLKMRDIAEMSTFIDMQSVPRAEGHGREARGPDEPRRPRAQAHRGSPGGFGRGLHVP